MAGQRINIYLTPSDFDIIDTLKEFFNENRGALIRRALAELYHRKITEQTTETVNMP